MSHARIPSRVIFLLLLFTPRHATGEDFVRILDPGNPVVTDMEASGGGSWIDLDDDGDLDLVVANGNLDSQNDALYLNTGGGGFVRVATGPVVISGGSSIGGVWGDYDEDGRVDLFVTNRNNFGNFLYHGEGDTTFTAVAGSPVVTDISNSNSASWTDVDRDGDLDLYVVNFSADDFLYLNSGPPSFTFTRAAAAPLPGASTSIVGAWADYDNDRDQDLFLGIAGTSNDVLWRNNGALNFTSIPFTDGRATLGASWGDYDNDGDLDLVACSFQNQRSILYRNSGVPGFALVPDLSSDVSNLAVNAVGSGWGDYDNDGDLDLFIAAYTQNNVLFENQGPPTYNLVRITAGPLVGDGGASFGCVWGDYDADGQLDLFVANELNQSNFLYHNLGNANSWVAVRCRGTASNGSAIGARVHVRAIIGGVPTWQMQEVVAQTGYNCGNLDLHFGLGNAAVVESLRVEWPSGRDDLLVGIAPNQLLRIEESTPSSVREEGSEGDPGVAGPDDGAPGEGPRGQDPTAGSAVQQELRLALESGGAPSVRFLLPSSGFVTLTLHDVAGRMLGEFASGWRDAGEHRVALDLRPPASGVYYCRLSFASGGGVARRVVPWVCVR